jgi:hypothetical protein
VNQSLWKVKLLYGNLHYFRLRNAKRFTRSKPALPANLAHLSANADNCAVWHEGAGWQGRRAYAETNIGEHQDNS